MAITSTSVMLLIISKDAILYISCGNYTLVYAVFGQASIEGTDGVTVRVGVP